MLHSSRRKVSYRQVIFSDLEREKRYGWSHIWEIAIHKFVRRSDELIVSRSKEPNNLKIPLDRNIYEIH